MVEVPTSQVSAGSLREDGWEDVYGVVIFAYPHSDAITLTKGGKYIQHMYNLYEDSSDYPGDDKSVTWEEVEVYTETIKRTRAVRKQGA